MSRSAESGVVDVGGAKVFVAILAAAAAVASCGRAPAKAPVVATVEATTPDPYRPCTLLSIEDATQITGQPFFRVMADNRVEGPRTSCAYAVGVGGLQGLVEIELTHADGSLHPGDLYAARCGAEAGARPAPPGATVGKGCLQKSGAPLLLIEDVALEASVMGRWGEVDSPRSTQLAALVAPRLAEAIREDGGGAAAQH